MCPSDFSSLAFSQWVLKKWGKSAINNVFVCEWLHYYPNEIVAVFSKSEIKFFQMKFETSHQNMFQNNKIESPLFYFDLEFLSKNNKSHPVVYISKVFPCNIRKK